MALDHTRDFWTAVSFDPLDLTQSSTLLFLTRWITHICAPGFIFLTGLSAYLHGKKLDTKKELATFLLLRGIVLIMLELTIVNLSWQFAYNYVFIQVIWALGISMIILAGLIYLPRTITIIACLFIIIFHEFINDDAIQQWLGSYEWLWILAHVRSGFKLFEFNTGVFAAYSIIPLFCLMYLGFAAGEVYVRSANKRAQILIKTALALSILFVATRLLGFGDPSVWDVSGGLLSLLNTAKYPMSFSFILMTMSIVFLIMAAVANTDNQLLNVMRTFGQASLFFYLLHVPFINLSAHIWTYIEFGVATNFFDGTKVWPQGYAPSLMRTYLFWTLLIVVLYYPCKWYLIRKKASDSKIYSFI